MLALALALILAFSIVAFAGCDYNGSRDCYCPTGTELDFNASVMWLPFGVSNNSQVVTSFSQWYSLGIKQAIDYRNNQYPEWANRPCCDPLLEYDEYFFENYSLVLSFFMTPYIRYANVNKVELKENTVFIDLYVQLVGIFTISYPWMIIIEVCRDKVANVERIYRSWHWHSITNVDTKYFYITREREASMTVSSTQTAIIRNNTEWQTLVENHNLCGLVENPTNNFFYDSSKIFILMPNFGRGGRGEDIQLQLSTAHRGTLMLTFLHYPTQDALHKYYLFFITICRKRATCLQEVIVFVESYEWWHA